MIHIFFADLLKNLHWNIYMEPSGKKYYFLSRIHSLTIQLSKLCRCNSQLPEAAGYKRRFFIQAVSVNAVKTSALSEKQEQKTEHKPLLLWIYKT